ASTDYFLGGRQFGWFALCMSTMATQLSAISFVSAPAFVGLRAGGGMQWLTFEFGVPLAMIIVMVLLGPMLHRSVVVSVYTFLAHVDRSRLRAVDFSNFGFDGREYGFWPMLIGGVFLYTSYYGTDQTQAQRILSARDEVTVKRLLLFNGLFRFPITLAYCCG